MPCLSVAGIAGPGDPFCTPDATLLTLESCRRAFPDILLCVSSNGYNVAPYLKELKTLGVGFITITVNAVNPDIGSRIYRWVGQEPALHGREGAAMLLDRQMEALEGLRAGGFSVKVNTVVIPGVNDEHVIDIARKVSVFKVDRMNLIGVIPVAGTSLACTPPPSSSLMARLRRSAQAFVPQMQHCARCRSDAVGLLHDDKPQPGFDGKPRPNSSCAAGISR
jgi:nitrogen fixation protein NifB